MKPPIIESLALSLIPDGFTDDARVAYLEALNTPLSGAGFVQYTRPGQYFHAAVELYDTLTLPADSYPPDTVFVFEAHGGYLSVQQARNRLVPAFEEQGHHATELEHFELVGLLVNPNLGTFSEEHCYAQVSCWDTPGTEWYGAAFSGLFPDSNDDAPEALAIHAAYVVDGQLLIFDVWRSETEFREYQQAVVLPALRQAAGNFYPSVVAARCLRLAVGSFIRYSAS